MNLDQLVEEIERLKVRIMRLEYRPPSDGSGRYMAVVAAGLDNGGAPMETGAINAAYESIEWNNDGTMKVRG